MELDLDLQQQQQSSLCRNLVVRFLRRTQPLRPAADAMVRVVHASPDAPAVDILVNGERAIENLAFGAATDYVALPAGEYQVQVVPTGAEAADAVIDAMLTLEGGKYYQVAAVGPVAEIAPAVFEVDASAVTEGMARVRVIHASPDAPAVDLTLADGTVIFGNLEFPNASDYAEVEGASYDLQVRPAGTEDVALDLPGVALDAGTIYDIFAIGTLADGTLSVLPLTTMPMAAMAEGDSMAADARSFECCMHRRTLQQSNLCEWFQGGRESGLR